MDKSRFCSCLSLLTVENSDEGIHRSKAADGCLWRKSLCMHPFATCTRRTAGPRLAVGHPHTFFGLPMLTCSNSFPRPGPGPSAAETRRHRRAGLGRAPEKPLDATDSQGRHLGVFLPRGTTVRGGDVLLTEDGSVRQGAGRAAAGAACITHCSAHGTPFDLTRAAYHLGNRRAHRAATRPPEDRTRPRAGRDAGSCT